MDDEVKELLERNLALAKENHRILKSLRRYHWMSMLWNLLIWTSLIAVPLYVYQKVLAPSLPTFFDLGNLVESYQAGPEAPF